MLQYAPVGVVVGVILLLELLLVAGRFVIAGRFRRSEAIGADQSCRIDNTRALGQLLYTRYVFLFQGAAGRAAGRHDRRHRPDAQHKSNVKRQDVFRQTAGASARDGHRTRQGQIGAGALNAMKQASASGTT